MLLDDELAAQRNHEQHAQPSADQRQKENAPVFAEREAQENQRGQREDHAAAADSPAEPVVCTMLFSRMLTLPNARRMLMESTEMGIEAETVSPARRPT